MTQQIGVPGEQQQYDGYTPEVVDSTIQPAGGLRVRELFAKIEQWRLDLWLLTHPNEISPADEFTEAIAYERHHLDDKFAKAMKIGDKPFLTSFNSQNSPLEKFARQTAFLNFVDEQGLSDAYEQAVSYDVDPKGNLHWSGYGLEFRGPNYSVVVKDYTTPNQPQTFTVKLVPDRPGG